MSLHVYRAVSRLLISLCFVAFFFLGMVQADTAVCLILVSSKAEPYMQALSGIMEVVEPVAARGILTLDVDVVTTRSPVRLVRKVLDASPDMIISVGTPVTEVLIASGLSVPVVYSMVLDPSREIRSARGVAGVMLDIPLDKQIEWFVRIVPGLRRLGVFYSDESEYWLSRVRMAALAEGLQISGIRMGSGSDPAHLLAERAEELDGLLAIPDGVIYNSVTTTRIIYFSLENRLPFMGLSNNFTRAGALFSLDCDCRDIGRQTGEMSIKILKGEDIEEVEDESPAKITPVINMRTARILGIRITDEMQKRVVLINR